MATIRLLDTNALAYNLTVFDLQEGDTLTNAHIHGGNSDETGGIFITLVGQPDQEGQEGRQAGIEFVGSNGVLEASGPAAWATAEGGKSVADRERGSRIRRSPWRLARPPPR